MHGFYGVDRFFLISIEVETQEIGRDTWPGRIHMNWRGILRFLIHPSYFLTMTAPAGQDHLASKSKKLACQNTLMLWQKQSHPALELAREHFTQALRDVKNREAACLSMRIHYAHSLPALWHLRSDVFLLIALYHNEEEAFKRLKVLNQHFPERSGKPFALD